MRRRLLLAVITLSGMACGATPTRPTTPRNEVDALLASWKAASGGEHWNSVASVVTKGTLAAGGLSGSFTSTVDAMTGRSVTHFALGAFSGAQGFDGKVSWEQGVGGEVTNRGAPEAVQSAWAAAWMGQMGYWFPARGAATFGPVRDIVDEGRAFRVVVATPPNGHAVALSMNPATHLLVRMVETEGPDTITTRLDDYQEMAGLRWPRNSIVDRTDAAGRTDPRARVELHTSDVAINVAVAASAFAAPPMGATARVTDPSGVTQVPFDLVNNHIYADALIDGKKVRVIVDTGGENLLTPAAAEKLGLELQGKLSGGGVGDERVETNLTRAHEVRLGAAVLQNPVFVVLDLGAIAALDGAPTDGLVGFEMFRRFAVTIDYAQHLLTLSEPAKFQPPAGAHVVPFNLAGQTPIVRGTLDGMPVRISVDTGSRSSLTLDSPFVKTRGIVEKYDAAPERITGWGVGGPALGRPVRFGALTIGDVTINDIAGDLYLGNKGALADPDLSGNLGGGVLRRFAVSFDYEARRMYLVPNADFAKADPFDRSGMWLLLDGDALQIAGVAPDSPAAAAKLAVHERIISIDGEPASRYPLSEWRRRLAELPVGSHVALFVIGGEGQRRVSLTLADAIPPHATVH